MHEDRAAPPSPIAGATALLLVGLAIGFEQWVALLGGIAGCAYLGARHAHLRPTSLGLFAMVTLRHAGVPWPGPAVAAFLVDSGLRLRLNSVAELDWWRSHLARPKWFHLAAGAALAVASSATLIVWHQSRHIEVWATYTEEQRELAEIVVVIAVGAPLIAIGEELVWRRQMVLMGEGHRLNNAGIGLITSLSFGVAHVGGFPSGVFGVGLATAFGALQYLLFKWSKNVAVIIGTHAIVDVAILWLLLA